MGESEQGTTLLDNFDLFKYPAKCPERSYLRPLEVTRGDGSSSMGIFLEAAGWVRLSETVDKIRYAPPLAGYVARTLRSCVVDGNSAAQVKTPRITRASLESSRILDCPDGLIPDHTPTVNPQFLVRAMAKKILASQDPAMEAAKQAVSEWVSSFEDMGLGSDTSDMAEIGAAPGRSHTQLGELLVSIDRQTGSLSFLMTGSEMGGEGPYSQQTKIYDPKKRKAPLAVIFHRTSAVRNNDYQPDPKVLEKSLFSALRPALALHILKMSDEVFDSSFGEASIKKVWETTPDSRVADSIGSLATAASKLRKQLGPDPQDSVLRKAAGELVTASGSAVRRQISQVMRGNRESPSKKQLTHPLDILWLEAATKPWLFQAYASAQVSKAGTLHLHGLSGDLFESVFSSIESSPDFVLHTSESEVYDKTYRQPMNDAIRAISSELDSPTAKEGRRALQRAREEIIAAGEAGTVGFLELVRGRGVCMSDGRKLPPVEAMRTMLGPSDAELHDDLILRRISEKIDGISAALSDPKQAAGVGSIRDFCSKVKKKVSVAKDLFGEEAVENLLKARASLLKAEKTAPRGGCDVSGAEKSALQKAVSECLCACFFGENSDPKPEHKQMVDALVSSAANSEFVYFAAQAGAEGLLKIGKAVDVSKRMKDLSKDGHDVLPLAYITVPGLPVGDWSMDSVAAAAEQLGGEKARKRATLVVNQLTGLLGRVESSGAADFFVNAVRSAIAARQHDAPEQWDKKTPETLSEEEVVSLLTQSGKMRATTARAVHNLISAVYAAPEGAHGVLAVQQGIREASAKVLSMLAAESVWERIPAGGSEKICKDFYSINEATGMPSCKEAWVHRIQSGALAAEAMLHRKYRQARGHGEWFYLLPAAESLVADAESMFSSPAVRSQTRPHEKGLLPLISDLHRSGTQVCAAVEVLPVHRDAYEEEVAKTVGAERASRVGKYSPVVPTKKSRRRDLICRGR